jgi:TPR repeat protein
MKSAKHDNTTEAENLFVKAEQYEEKGSFKSAFNCLLAASQLGHVSSQVNLGNFYASGIGVRKNLDKAASCYKKAYKSGDNCGALNLAIDKKMQGDMRSGVIWFKKAIALNCGDACIELAKIYKTRKGGQKPAANLLKRALRLSRDDISDASREEAESLLEAMANE